MGSRMNRVGANGEIYESPEEKQRRLDFEDSHPFRNGDKVIILFTVLEYVGECPYLRQVAKVTRVTTSPATGSCIVITYGGVSINVWEPNEQLCLATKMGELLYA